MAEMAGRREYEKPAIREVKMQMEEAVLAACKAVGLTVGPGGADCKTWEPGDFYGAPCFVPYE